MTRIIRETLIIGLIGGLFSSPTLAAGSDSFGVDSTEDKIKQAAEAIESENYRRAVSLLSDIISDDRNNADALNYMGYSQRKLGDYNKAFNYYRRALKVDPVHRGANEYIGQAYLESKQPEKAATHLEQLKKICGTDCKEYVSLKKAYDSYRSGAPKS